MSAAGAPPGAGAGEEVRAWLVDLDGTLYHAGPLRPLFAFWLWRAGGAQRRAIAVFREEHERRQRWEPGLPRDPFARQLESAAARLGMPAAELERWVRPLFFERVRPWLRRLRRRGLVREIEAFRRAGGRTALVSDYPARGKLAAMGLAPLFEVVVAPGEPGGPTELKPDPGGYLAAAAALGVPPAQCLVIGDRDDCDGGAARAAGMRYRRV